MLSTDIILALNLTINQNVMKRVSFELLSRILIFTLMKLNWNYFGFGVNNKSKCDETVIFRASLQNLDLQLNETKLDSENVSNLNYFDFGVTVNENVMKWLFFMLFCRILTCVLSTRRRKT